MTAVSCICMQMPPSGVAKMNELPEEVGSALFNLATPAYAVVAQNSARHL